MNFADPSKVYKLFSPVFIVTLQNKLLKYTETNDQNEKFPLEMTKQVILLFSMEQKLFCIPSSSWFTAQN